MKKASSGEKQPLTNARSEDAVQGGEIGPASTVLTTGIQWYDEGVAALISV